MALIRARVRQWGGSLGIVIPKEDAREAGLAKGQEVSLELKRLNPFEKAFGSLQNLKIDSQKVKDELRKEWSK